MPVISNHNRTYKIDDITYYIPKSISFIDNCVIQYSQTKIDELYANFRVIISEILYKYCPNDWWLIGGSLLGYIRQNSLLCWDDDCDFAITKDGFNILLEKLTEINRHLVDVKANLEILEYMCGFKIYNKTNGNGIADFFITDSYKSDSDTLVYSGPCINGKCLFNIHTYIFTKIHFKKSDVFPIQKLTIPCSGGDYYLNLPKNPIPILHNNYSDKCLDCIVQPPKEAIIVHSSYFNNISSNWTYTKYKNVWTEKYPNVCLCFLKYYLLIFETIFSNYHLNVSTDLIATIINKLLENPRFVSDVISTELALEFITWVINEPVHFAKIAREFVLDILNR
jgi:hypothetical protein